MRTFLALAALSATLLLTGCDEDKRNMEEKLTTPNPDYSTRLVMSCPKCGAPQRPHRISQTKSYYKCTGLPPKFQYHSEKEWSRRVDREEHCEK